MVFEQFMVADHDLVDAHRSCLPTRALSRFAQVRTAGLAPGIERDIGDRCFAVDSIKDMIGRPDDPVLP